MNRNVHALREACRIEWLPASPPPTLMCQPSAYGIRPCSYHRPISARGLPAISSCDLTKRALSTSHASFPLRAHGQAGRLAGVLCPMPFRGCVRADFRRNQASTGLRCIDQQFRSRRGQIVRRRCNHPPAGASFDDVQACGRKFLAPSQATTPKLQTS